MAKKRWAVPLVLMGAVGCSKVELPKMTVGGNNAGGQLASPVTVVGPQSEFEKICMELPGMAEIPLFTVEEYPALIEFIKSQSPLLRDDKERFLRSHARALQYANRSVVALLEQHGKMQELNFFRRNVARFIRYSHPNPENDLVTMLRKVMELNEGSKCASAYLSHFYSTFVKELDPFGDVTFGLTENRAPEDTLSLQPPLPDELKNAPPTRLAGYVMVATLPRLQRSPLLDGVLRTIESGYATQNFRAVLFDLRYASGTEIPVIAQIRASASKNWGAAPIILWTNRKTRGVAAVLVKQLSTHPNVLALGTDDETYGYGRKLVERSITLVAGLHPLTLTIGSEFLQPPGVESDSDGYRLRLPSDRLLGEDKVDKAIERAEQWSSQAPPGDLATLQTDPNAVSSPQPDQAQLTTADGAVSPASAQQDPSSPLAAGNPGATPDVPPSQDPTMGLVGGPPSLQPPADIPPDAAKSSAPPTTF